MKTYSYFQKIRIWGFSLLFVIALVNDACAQTRKFTSQFSHFQGYFNPGLAGYEGSTVRGFVRNQWAGMEGAPKTFFFSTELDFGEMAGLEDPALMGKNAISASVLSESNGAFRENEFIVSYASRIRLSESHNLRLGAGVIHQSIRLDGNSLTWEEQNDPALGEFIGQFSNLQVIDFNIGLALTHKNYYLSYGIHRVNGGLLSKGDKFINAYPAEKMIQFGVRESLTDQLALIINGFYRSRKDLPEVMEFNVKALLMNKVWIGAGQRVSYATNFNFGFLTQNMRIGYLYELPVNKSYLMPGGTHEITAVINLFNSYQPKYQREISIW
ncbi:MAG: type IX secretion system membrane protein PorP/SprF [Algoriphagus sp.]|jgi:type IX secretion system PorP/SprF family membrane protein|nr:type IX secretion system membrane protein PorP/SprF [Algoriphagus sp.]